jgi:hypothetical protein
VWTTYQAGSAIILGLKRNALEENEKWNEFSKNTAYALWITPMD